MRRVRVAGLLSVVVLAAGCSSPAETEFTAGADGAGDPYFPKYGNGGYDVAGYDLNLRYDPAAGTLGGTATIAATATQDLSRFNLDLAHLKVSAVKVDGAAATSAQDGAELVVTPASGLAEGKAFTVVVDYAGTPGRIGDKVLGEGGWLRTDDGAIALGQPESASTWYPVNDHPSDKATFKLAMAVPDGVEVLSNGVQGERTAADGWTTWRWSESSPMASYLSMVVIGQYRVTESTHDGKPMVTAVPEGLASDGPSAESMALTGEVTDFLATKFGPYPFDANGGVVVDDPRIGYALETQSRPVYGNSFFSRGVNGGVVAHELAHQWFGDSVALEKWQDIWLNEGFATYAEWLWSEHRKEATVEQTFDRVYASYPWDQPGQKAGDPGANRIFGTAVYQRGAMTVYALRKTIGDEAFGKLLTEWTATHHDGNANTQDLIELVRKVSGKDVTELLKQWLYTEGKPAKP